jgi:hypothetical protein
MSCGRRILAGVAATILIGCTHTTPREPGEFEPSLAVANDGFALTWYEYAPESAEIFYQRVDATGARVGPKHRLTIDAADSYEPDIAALDDAIAVAWYDKDRKSGALKARLGVWDRAGRNRWSKQLSRPEHSSRNAIVRTFGTALFCAWIEQDGTDQSIMGQWFDATGQARSAAVQVARASKTTWNLNAAIDTLGRAWIVFNARVSTRADELYIASLDSTGAQVRRLTADDGRASRYPDIAISANRLGIAWFDERDGDQEVYLFAGELGSLDEFPRQTTRVTSTRGHSIGAYLTWSAGTLGVAWCDDSSGHYSTYFQQFDAQGRSMRDPERLSNPSARVWVPAIHAVPDGFVAAWSEFTSSGRGRPAEPSTSLYDLAAYANVIRDRCSSSAQFPSWPFLRGFS